jgi:hypothetical protein
MTLIALLLLYPTSSLHARGLDDAIPGHYARTRAVAPVIRDRGAASICVNPAGGGEHAEGEWGDDEGVQPLVDCSVLSRQCRHDDRLSRPLISPRIVQHSARSRHLRC